MKRILLPALLAIALPLTAAPALAPAAATAADPRVPPAELGAIPIALLVDIGSGQTLYGKEQERRFVPASITKVMTLYVAFELLARGELDPRQQYEMSEDAWKHWHGVGSTMFLDRDRPVSVDDLLLGIANVSANDGCVVLAEGAAGSVPNWIALMNAEARRLGMKNSQFGTPNGWMDDGQTYVTAGDLAKLATALITRHPELYQRYVGHKTITLNGITQRNHDPLLGKVEGADGIKTGFTNQAGYGFLGSATRNGRRLVMVVAGADRPRDRAQAAAALMNWGFAAFDSRPLFPRGAKVGDAEVQDGAAGSVPLIAPAAYSATTPRGDAGQPIRLRVVYNGPLIAPVKKGDIVGQLEINSGGQEPHRLPLAAGTNVAKAGIFMRVVNGLRGIFT